ncbi:MAG: hypothetical protein MUF05_03735 [Candidatus Omnitrophica bacterium]|jgi:hypothetical protein|nr:hypothetical protein [Candidatus Omnitrophota bacterium]
MGLIGIILSIPLLIILLHAAFSRYLSKIIASAQMAAILAVFSAFPIVLLLGVFFAKAELSALYILYMGLVYFSLGHAYFHIFNMSETARRIRILYEIKESPDALTFDQLKNIYSADLMLDIRLQRLLKIKAVRLQDGKYKLNGGLLYWAALFSKFWSAVLNFDSEKYDI